MHKAVRFGCGSWSAVIILWPHPQHSVHISFERRSDSLMGYLRMASKGTRLLSTSAQCMGPIGFLQRRGL